MSASKLPANIADGAVYRSKWTGVLFVERATHGSPAWYNEGGSWIELRYWDQTGLFGQVEYQSGWVTLAEYKERVAMRKRVNFDYHQSNLWLLRQKIEQKRGRGRLLRLAERSGWDTMI